MHIPTHVLFIVYAAHEYLEFNSMTYIEEDKNIAERKAKEWLIENVWHHLREVYEDDDGESEEISKLDLKEKYLNDTLENTIDFIRENSDVSIITEYYEH